jgi:hypothetical protein
MADEGKSNGNGNGDNGNGKGIVGIKGMGRKSYIAVSGMAFIAAAQSNQWPVVAITLVALIGMGLQFILDLSDKDEEK